MPGRFTTDQTVFKPLLISKNSAPQQRAGHVVSPGAAGACCSTWRGWPTISILHEGCGVRGRMELHLHCCFVVESPNPSSLCVHPSYPPAAMTRTHPSVSPRHRVPWRHDLLGCAGHSQRSTGTVRVITTVPLTRRLQERTRMQDWIFYNETLCMQYVTKITQFSIFP